MLLWLAHFWPYLLGALACILLLSGIDDFIPLAICVWGWLKERSALHAQLFPTERRIAIFVPCWREADVIERMVCDNIAAIRYRNFDFFLGVYPNDPATNEAANRVAAKFRNVHVAVCRNPGPTSKADCLNEIYRSMQAFELERGVRFDTVVLHDAEDMIHPEALSIIDRERSRYAMVQIPVLPLPTPLRKMTHGVYCDEFSEYQIIDMRARQFSGSFVPSNGVGTGFARDILDDLAASRGGHVFDAASLTEDYEIGVHIHYAGYAQCFVPLKKGTYSFAATREYFPRTVRSAIRQRTRWVTGIALQCWERTGWRGSLCTRYWFWRDRKGLFANPLSFLANLLFTVGAGDWLQSAATHRPWAFAISNSRVIALCWLTLFLQCLRLGLRMFCVARVFGTRFALAVPLRSFHANFINCCASFGAMMRYANARIHGRPLVWLKTEHAYPDSTLPQREDLGEILVACGCLSEQELAQARKELPERMEIAEFLLTRGLVSDEDLCNAISRQSGLPTGHVDTKGVDQRIVRSLPLHLERRFGVLPFAVQEGRLRITGPQVPPSELFEELKSFTKLPVEFQLVSRRNYEELRKLLEARRQEPGERS